MLAAHSVATKSRRALCKPPLCPPSDSTSCTTRQQRTDNASDNAGLTTLEYAVLLVMICIGGLVVLAHLGKSLDKVVGDGEQKFSSQLGQSSGAAGLRTTLSPTDSAAHFESRIPSASAAPTAANASNGSALTPAPREYAKNEVTPEPPGWFERVKAATIDNPTLTQFAHDHPIATVIGKEAAVAAAETLIPGLAAFNAARTLADPNASRVDKAVAAATIVTSIVPPLAAAIKGVRQAATIAKVAEDVSKTTKAIEKTAEVAADAANAASRAESAEKAAAHAIEVERTVGRAAAAEQPVGQIVKTEATVGSTAAGLAKPGRSNSGSAPGATASEINEAVDSAFESGRVTSGPLVQAPANGVSGPGPKKGAGAIWYHDNVNVRGAGPNGETVSIRTHSPNPNAPPGSYSRGNYTTQVNTRDGRYLLPDGTWKKISEMTPTERAAAHYPSGN